MSYDYIKRGLDVMLASSALVLSLPVQVVVAVLVARKLGRPVLFKQARPGRGGRIFTLVKFRTMANAAPADSGVDADASRLSAFGQKLRSTSLDELPTLINVLKGDMSMVGPRPLLVQYLPRYTPEQARRHDVRPGVTGLAQVKGRNAIGWGEKFALDNEYVRNRSLVLDGKILFWTIAAVIRRDGVSAENHVTTHEFMGNAEGAGSE